MVIYRNDQVWFDSSSDNIARIYQTDQFGTPLNNEFLFEPQENSINYFMKEFYQEGVFYFTTDIDSDPKKKEQNQTEPLRIVVLPDIRFHYASIHKNDFNHHPLMTNVGDFVIWQFDHVVSRNVIQIAAESELQDLVSCHERAMTGRNRQWLAVECGMPGTYFFANPGLHKDKLKRLFQRFFSHRI